jgi:hypothetical protein
VKDSTDIPRVVALPEPRELTDDERRTLEFAVAAPDAPTALRLQAKSAVVWGECDCGCASIGLGRQGPAVPGAEGVLRLEAVGKNLDGDRIEVNLHVVDGLLEELEIWSYVDGEVRTAPLDLATLEYVPDD